MNQQCHQSTWLRYQGPAIVDFNPNILTNPSPATPSNYYYPLSDKVKQQGECVMASRHIYLLPKSCHSMTHQLRQEENKLKLI